MQTPFSRAHRRRSPFALTAALIAIAIAVAIPTPASAANSMTLSIEPAIPAKGKPFQLIAQGAAESVPNGDSNVDVYINSGSAPCGSTSGFESETSWSVIAETFVYDGPFDLRDVFANSTGNAPFGLADGARVGIYHACGYITSQGFGPNPNIPPTRLDFTVGGTCDSATTAVAAAEQKVAKAKSKLAKAKDSGDRKKIKKAKKAVKKAKKALKKSQADQAALC